MKDETSPAAAGVPIGHTGQNACFGCGPENRSGLRLRFYADAAGRILCRFRLPRRFLGPPGYAHGGIIATLLDEAMSKANRHRNIFAMTRQMEVEYLRPVPLGVALEVEGFSEAATSRKHHCRAELRDGSGRILAKATGLFIEVKPQRLLHGQQGTE